MNLFKKDFDARKILFAIVVISATFWGIACLSGALIRSWDGLTHVFFAKGYANNWWTLWDERWYGGYNKASYPPLAHQLMGLIMIIIHNTESSFSIIFWVFLSIFPVAIYKFSRIFFNYESSLIAAFISIFIPSIRVMDFIFGQYSGFVSLIFLLFSVSSYADYLKKGSWKSGILSVGWLGCVAASHTNTLFFLSPPLFFFTSLSLWSEIRENSAKRFLIKNLKIISLYVVIILLVIFPFWVWFLNFRMQTPILHPSRWNLLSMIGTGIFKVYFLDIHGFLLFAYITFFLLAIQDKSYWLLLLCFILYFILGLGGSTNLPSMIFGKSWEWLTYERFGVWASIIALPMIGYSLYSLQNHYLGVIAIFPILLVIFDSFLWLYNPDQGQITRPRIDLSPVYEIFQSNPECEERFLSLGFDYQMPEFSIFSKAKTLDGLWHTARTDILLQQSGIGSIDSSLGWSDGEKVLREFLARKEINPANCIFVNETNISNARKYKQILSENGWIQENISGNLISYWTKSHKDINNTLAGPNSLVMGLQLIIWGCIPLFVLTLSCLLVILILIQGKLLK